MVAENVVRASMVEAFSKADFAPVRGKRFDVKVTGFAKDEVEFYLAHIARTKAEEAGGVRDGAKPQVHVEVVVHTCGTDLVASPWKIEVVWQNKRILGETLVDLCFRDEAGPVAPPQTLYGVAGQRQSVFLSLFQDPGFYYVGEGLHMRFINPVDYRIPLPAKPTTQRADGPAGKSGS